MKQTASYRLATSDLHRILTRTSAFRSLVALGGDWLLIIASAALSVAYPNWPTYLAACLVIASRQHALLVLMHEGAHQHLFSSQKWNDHLTNLFTAWPLGISMERYREHHMRHHQFTNSQMDPDWGRKVAHPHWQFPKTSLKFWRDFLPYAWGLGLKEMGFALYALGTRPRNSPEAFLFYATAIMVITYAHGWAPVLCYWAIPYLTILPVLMKVRSIAEHLGLPNQSELSASRNVIGSPIEAFFFGPHQNSLHLIHHLFPQVPWFNLATFRQGLRIDKHFSDNAHENRGYFLPFFNSALSDLTRAEPRPAAIKSAALPEFQKENL